MKKTFLILILLITSCTKQENIYNTNSFEVKEVKGSTSPNLYFDTKITPDLTKQTQYKPITENNNYIKKEEKSIFDSIPSEKSPIIPGIITWNIPEK